MVVDVNLCLGVVGFWWFKVFFFFWLYFLDVVSKLCNENFFFCCGENCNGERVGEDNFWVVFFIMVFWVEIEFNFFVGFFCGELWEYILLKDLVFVKGFVLVECL